MSDTDTEGPFLFDVGVVALAHSDAPVRDVPLSYVRDAVRGDIEAIVPHAVVFGAHTVLTTYYGYSNADASRVLSNFTDADRIRWVGGESRDVVQSGLARASDANIDGWDGYYAAVAVTEGANTVLTLDQEFERVDAFDTEVVLSAEQFETLDDFLGAD